MSAIFQETLLDQTCTGSVTGASFDCPDISMLQVGVIFTAGSGTVTSCDVYLQGSADSGTNWFSLLADHGVTDGGTAFTTPAIKIVDAKATTTAENCQGVYKHLPVSKIRAMVTLTGTGPSLPIKIVAEGK